jgi:hypothetical protein
MKKLVTTILTILTFSVSFSQVDTIKNIQKNNTQGMAFKNLQSDSSFSLPQDTFRLKSTWRGMAFKTNLPYYWNGTKWNAFGLSIDSIRASISLTTTGNSGASTYNSSTGVFNIPQYTLSGLGGVAISDTATMLANYITGAYNGLTKSSKNIKLGGALTENTTIGLYGTTPYTIKFTNINQFSVDSARQIRMQTFRPADSMMAGFFTGSYLSSSLKRAYMFAQDTDYYANSIVDHDHITHEVYTRNPLTLKHGLYIDENYLSVVSETAQYFTVSNADENLLIGTGSSAVASAKLELKSTTQGFLPPRMTTTERDLISLPATGLLIWNTTDSTLQQYRGLSGWANIGGGITLAAIGSTPNANGATISGNTLNLEPASTSHGGVVTTGFQTFTGIKAFNAGINVTAAGNFLVGGNTTTSNWAAGAYNTSAPLFYTQPSSGTITAGRDYFGSLHANPSATEAASGVHNLVANTAFIPIQLTNGTATTTHGATVYIGGSAVGSAAISKNYALWVDSGLVRIDERIIKGDNEDTVAYLSDIPAGTTYSFSNGLTESPAGTVKIGGSLTGHSNIDGGANYEMSFSSSIPSGSSRNTLKVTNSGLFGVAIKSEATNGGTGIEVSSNSGPGANIYSSSGTGAQISSTTNTGVTISSTSGAAATYTVFPSSTNTVVEVSGSYRLSSGTATDGIGQSRGFYNQTSDGTTPLSNSIISKLLTANTTTRTAQLLFTGVSNANVDTLMKLGGYTTLTESTATAFTKTTVGTGKIAGGQILVTIEANDATDYQARTLRFIWSAVNKAGTTTVTISTPEEVVAASTGTLTATITATDDGSGVISFKADATSSLTQTTLRATYQVHKNF